MVCLHDRPDRRKSQLHAVCPLESNETRRMRLPSEDSLRHEQAAIALAVVSTKAGKLTLDRTLWAMRRAAEPKPPRKTPREGGLRGPTAATGLRPQPAMLPEEVVALS